MRKWLRFALCVAAMSESALAHDPQLAIDLSGEWQFRIGDQMEFRLARFDDRDWDKIRVPSRWEDAGFPGYDGYAWYRKRFFLSGDLQNKELLLHLGRIDDVDQVYLNGELIGFNGLFPPVFRTAFDMQREYVLPARLLKWNQDNVLAVRVFDEKRSGGITEGEIGIRVCANPLRLKVDLSGDWLFAPGDDNTRRSIKFDDHTWKRLTVPMSWEYQGFPDYDGVAWYRKYVDVPRELNEQPLLLVLGYINDIDEVFWNGELVGRSGRFPDKDQRSNFNSSRDVMRAYALSPDLVQGGQKAVIAVRVMDFGRWGGIFKGKIGLTTAEWWLQYRQSHIFQFDSKETNRKP
jgi:sialate O-acetylesterase